MILVSNNNHKETGMGAVDLIRIGAGNKTHDKFYLSLDAALIIVFGATALLKSTWAYYLAIFITTCVLQMLMIIVNHYVFIQGDSIVIDHVFKKRILIKKNLCKEISTPMLSIPYSDELTISFTDGRSFRFKRSDNTAEDLNKKIRQEHP
ncbi:hypothetical protein WSM22_27210 [Cytophagales bacterium WSM2-2]|nr:hypothetical protein WSM22_27210 [Cytophagales bacterium WSM2-2]